MAELSEGDHTGHYGRESGDWADGPPEDEIEARPGDHGTCVVCGREIVLREKIGFSLLDPPGTPTRKTLEWEHTDRWNGDISHSAELGGPA